MNPLVVLGAIVLLGLASLSGCSSEGERTKGINKDKDQPTTSTPQAPSAR